MDSGTVIPVMLAMLNGWEVFALWAVILVLFGAKELPKLHRGFGRGIWEVRRGFWEVAGNVARDAGESLGGIYGKPAGEAITTNYQVAELYDFSDRPKAGFRWWKRLREVFVKSWERVLAFVRRLLSW